MLVRYRGIPVRALGLVVVLVVALTSTTIANPIPDSILVEMNDLARAYPEGLSQEAEAQLVDLMGRYHYHFWAPDVRDLIGSRLDTYMPVLLASQEPGHSIDFDLHRWLRSTASPSQQGEMCQVLRRWLVEPMTEAPSDGGMVLQGPASAVRARIMQERVAAAEVLSDYRDTAAIPMMVGLAEQVESETAWSEASSRAPLKWFLSQALDRLNDPSGGRLFEIGEDGSVRFVRDLDAFDRMTLGTMGGHGLRAVAVDSTTASALLPSLSGSMVSSGTSRGYPGFSLRVWFADGASAEFSPTHDRPQLDLTNNTRIERTRLRIENDALWAQLNAMHEAGYLNR